MSEKPKDQNQENPIDAANQRIHNRDGIVRSTDNSIEKVEKFSIGNAKEGPRQTTKDTIQPPDTEE